MNNFVVVFLLVLLAGLTTVMAQNVVIFDNQSGEQALVKLIGPTYKEVEVPNDAKLGVDASAGRYIIKVRYGMPDKYHYAKGQEFDVKQTSTTRSEITITLHKVVAGNYESQPISKEEFGKLQEPMSPGTTTTERRKPETPAVFYFKVPDDWVNESKRGHKWVRYARTVENVSELGKALGYSEGDTIGHPYWADEDEKKEFQGVYFHLKEGFHGIQLVAFMSMVPIGGRTEHFEFPPFLELEYYTFRGFVYSAQPITIRGKTWPVMSKVVQIDHKFVRNEEKNISGRRCLRADPIVLEVFDLGNALGYTKGEKIGPSYWAEWQPKDDYAANPVAPYETK